MRWHHSKLVVWAQTHAHLLAPPSWPLLILVVLEYSLKGQRTRKQPNRRPPAVWAVPPKGRLPPAALWRSPCLCRQDCAAAPSKHVHPRCVAPRQACLLGEQEGVAVPVAAGGTNAQGSPHWTRVPWCFVAHVFSYNSGPMHVFNVSGKWYFCSAFPLVEGLSSQLTSFVKER